MVIKSAETKQNPLHARIRSRIVEMGETPEGISRKAGLDKTYLRKLFDRPSASPAVETLERLAAALEMPLAEMLGTAEPTIRMRDFRPATGVDMPARHDMPNDIPVLGTAAGSHLKGAFQLEPGSVIDYVRRPPALMGAKNAYAIYVEGTSMAEEHKPGELRFVHPDRPPRPGDSVVVQVKVGEHSDIEAMIGHYRRRTPERLVIGKLNPAADVELKLSTVLAVHKVLTMNELFGV